MSDQEICDATSHKWDEQYYGYVCVNCGLFFAYGSEPWMPVDTEDYSEAYYSQAGLGGEA